MAVSRRDCATRRGGHCVTNTGSGFSCVISTITNREYAGDQWSPVFYCFVGNHRSGCRNNRTGRRVSSSPKRSPCRLSPGAPAARRCRSRAHAASHALDGRAAGGAHRVHECDWVLGAVHSKRAAAHNRRGGDLLGDRSCKFRADTRLRQSVNVHQNKRARCPAESSECRKQVFIYMVHLVRLADRREYRVGGFYMCARCRLAAVYRRYGDFLYLKSLNNEYKLDIQQ